MSLSVSIVTPSYNQAQFLETTIRSVLGQDYPGLEYFVIDGGSTDGSVEIIRRHERQLTGWVSEKDRGQAEAINKGMQRATGEIVAWLNSDDVYLPGAVSEALALFEQHPQASLIYGDALTIDGQGRPLNVLRFADWSLEDLLAFRIICQPAVFMRREAFLKAGGMKEDYHFMLDHHLWLRIARSGEMVYSRRLWAAARHHAGAKNIAQAAGFAEETGRALDWLLSESAYAGAAGGRRKTILAGAHRLQGRYYLDGGKARTALKYYLRALGEDPAYGVRHAHRMLYALASMAGCQRLLDGFNRRRAAHSQARARTAASSRLKACGLSVWQGVNLNEA